MARPLDGPRIVPRGGKPSALVVLLHGYGANGDDLIALGDAWRRSLPDFVFVAPNAPEMIPGMHGGLQWFPLTLRDPSEYWRGVTAAQPALDRFLDSELSRYRLRPERLVLVGFSQGTMMALHADLRRAVPVAAIVGYSGIFVLPEKAKPEAVAGEIKSKPPVLLIHGAQDDLIPAQALFQSAQALAALEVPVEWHLSEGIGHGIDQEGLRHGGTFLARRFGLRS